MKPSCLIIDPTHEIIITKLEEIGISVSYRPDIRPEEVLQIIHQYEGVVIRSKMPVNREFLERASRLKYIARAGAGLDQIDLREVEIRNIHLINAPEGNMDALGEHTLGMLLALLNNITRADKEIKSGTWNREANRGSELGNKTVGIIGFGYMGKAFAKRLTGFGCKIMVYDKNPEVKIEKPFIASTFKEIKDNADIISFHIPLDADNKSMVNYQYLSEFNKNIWLLNTARGEILVLKDLLQHIKEGKIKGAALDVLENEKLHALSGMQKEVFEELTKSDKVILTPHVAGWSFESYQKISEVLASKIRDFTLI